MNQMERKEPTIGGLVPNNDETIVQPAPQSTAAEAPATPARQRKTSAASARTSSSIAALALIVAVASLGGSAYLAWQLQKSQQYLGAAELRIQELEKRLELSDDESSQSVTAIRAKLKWADSEIRKLWGVSYDTNRKRIGANKDKLAQLEKNLKKAQKQATTAQQLADGHKSALQTLQQESDARSKRLADAVAAVGKTDTALADQRKRLQDAVDLASRVDRKLGQLSADLVGRVKTNEDAIEAIDAYRRNINRDMLQLKQRLDQLQAPVGSP